MVLQVPRYAILCGVSLILSSSQPVFSQSLPVNDQRVREAMLRSAKFYVEQVAAHGGYVYRYDLDLSHRWGEGEATRDQIWVQPPGTPTVGLALLEAFDATGEPFYLNGAVRAGEALVYGQLQSGGWTNCIDFAPNGKRVARYRSLGKSEARSKKNNSSLDDGQTQSAIIFLTKLDQALGFRHASIHEAAKLALDRLLTVQFPSGAFPQVWDERLVARETLPQASDLRGNFPDYDWRSEGRIKEYWDLYTLNDDVAVYTARALHTAYEVYGDERLLRALERLGQFLVAAQMPEPQPAWAQQYNYAMQPVWARKFEPPAIASSESQGIIALLMDLYELTGDQQLLKPIPAAIGYLERSRLPSGQLPRYFELRTNRPLYMQRRGDAYTLTYDDQNLPQHYGWKIESALEELHERYRQLHAERGSPAAKTLSEPVIREIIHALDAQGRWLSTYQGERLVGQTKFAVGTRYIDSQVFATNLSHLAQFLQASKNTTAVGESK